MLIVGLIYLDIVLEVGDDSLKLFDFLSVLQFLVGDVLGEGLHVVGLQFLVKKGEILFIKFKVGLDKFHKKQIVIINKGGESLLGIEGGCLGVPLIVDLLTQIGDDLIEGLEMVDILVDQCLGTVV